MTRTFDALVVGAGAGGLFAAARLAHAGYRTLVVERMDKVGGRASSTDVDGFTVNDGAIVIEVGGITEETFAEVGAEFDVRTPSVPVLYRVGGRNLDVTRGGWGVLLSTLTRQGAKLLSGIGAARTDDDALPGEELSTADWVARYSRSEAVQGVFRNMCASVFAVGSDELPARVFLTYFTRRSAFKRFGFCPQGTIGIWRSLAETITARGGEVWLSSEVSALHVSDGRVTGATVERDGGPVEITCTVAVSDTGPAATAALLGDGDLPADYRERVRAADRPCAMLAVNFASRERLLDVPGLLLFSTTDRLCYVASFTETCPEMAPPGWHLYVGASVPTPSVGAFDADDETERLLADLRKEVPGFDEARVLSTAVMRDGWPPQRAVAGYDLPPDTPVPNLWNVGDGVKEYANGGTTACAETAKLVVDRIRAAYPLPARA
ncbi:phytoene desaturase family protein [Pseudonocardia endophytica]|uniref:Phytoene dehydrogenase-like protein n=1 Tax=Pseudonocardia endophytica TaxID=401976 RepID=A0A4R1HWY1_PSEEN|nr:FAD-dependent oxidoreductase [Pseudonocardia endophytica]TCK24539.1 phytoene dehydrogenase-like protein [Pseudonocardia endophytica]